MPKKSQINEYSEYSDSETMQSGELPSPNPIHKDVI
jgi:hypothetical protein